MPTNPDLPGGSGGYGDGGLVGALVQVGAGLYDSYQNRKTSKENTQRTIDAQKREAELAYQRSIQMWNMQNMYNDPQSQMQRFVDAGLNPHLIYGQGNAGNASSMPSYQAPNVQYRYEAPAYGAAIQSMLPTLMAVGTWLQNMRAGEVDITKKLTETERARQLVDFLFQKNPRVLSELDNKLSIFPYQASAIKAGAEKSWRVVGELEQEFQHKWGRPLMLDESMYSNSKNLSAYGGMRALERDKKVKELESMAYKNKLLEAQSSWADFDVTNPQALMQMVLSGVLGLAGQSMRLSNRGSVRDAARGNAPKRIKTYYDKGKRRSQVVDY